MAFCINKVIIIIIIIIIILEDLREFFLLSYSLLSP